MLKSLAKIKKLDIVANSNYIEREALISDKLSVSVAFSFVNAVFNMSHRNEIIIGGNQFIYNDAQTHDNSKTLSAWELFKSNYEKNKNNISNLLDKNIFMNIAKSIEAELPFPVFSIHRDNFFGNMISEHYEQVNEFNKRILASLSDEVNLSDKYFFKIFDQFFYNLFPTVVGDYIQLVYLPLNIEAYSQYLNDLEQEGLFENTLDRELFTQTYCFLEEIFMSFLYEKMPFARLTLLDNDDGSQHLYFDVDLTFISINNDKEYDIIPINFYPEIRSSLNQMLDITYHHYSYLMPDFLNSSELNEDNFKLFNEEQKSAMFVVAFSSANIFALLKLLNFDNKSLYTTIQYRDPIIMSGIMYALNQNNYLYVLMNEKLAETLIYYEDDWNESPMKFSDLLIDLTTKLEFYEVLVSIINNMLNVPFENESDVSLYPMPANELWENLKNIKKYFIKTHSVNH